MKQILAIVIISCGLDAQIVKLLVPAIGSLWLKGMFRVGIVQKSLSHLVSGSVYNIVFSTQHLEDTQ